MNKYLQESYESALRENERLLKENKQLKDEREQMINLFKEYAEKSIEIDELWRKLSDVKIISES